MFSIIPQGPLACTVSSPVSQKQYFIYCVHFFLVVSGEKVNLVLVILLWPEQLLMKCSLIIALRVTTGRYSSLTEGGRLQSKISDYLTLTRREFCSISPSQALGMAGGGTQGFLSYWHCSYKLLHSSKHLYSELSWIVFFAFLIELLETVSSKNFQLHSCFSVALPTNGGKAGGRGGGGGVVTILFTSYTSIYRYSFF